jgi:hypothetical protein
VAVRKDKTFLYRTDMEDDKIWAKKIRNLN